MQEKILYNQLVTYILPQFPSNLKLESKTLMQENLLKTLMQEKKIAVPSRHVGNIENNSCTF